MTNDELIENAIDQCLGCVLSPGAVVAMRTKDISHEFLRYDGDEAIVELAGIEKRWPRNLVFDVNAVRKLAFQEKYRIPGVRRINSGVIIVDL